MCFLMFTDAIVPMQKMFCYITMSETRMLWKYYFKEESYHFELDNPDMIKKKYLK